MMQRQLLPHRSYGHLLWRETRGSFRRFVFFVLCLAVGVTAIVCVAGLTENLERRIQREARQLLAADLTISGLQPPSPEIETFLSTRDDLEVTRVRELVTVAARPSVEQIPGTSQLIELKVIDGDYPFYGRLETEPQSDLRNLLADQEIVAAPDLLARLDLATGDSLRIGEASFRVTGQVLREPDRVASPFSLGPRVFMTATDFEITGLEQLGSRIIYRTLLKLPDNYGPQVLDRLAADLREIVGEAGPYRVRTYIEAQEELQSALGRASNFLGLVALLSLLLGGLGIAQTTRAWIASRMDDVAILRCLGLRPTEVLRLYLTQTAILALVGSAFGVASGVLIQAAVPRLLPGILDPSHLTLWQPWVFLRGLGLGLGVALLFSLRSLLTVRSVPPLRVLRKDVEPLPRGRWASLMILLLLGGGIWAVAAVQAASAIRGLQFAVGLAVASVLLVGVALLIMRSLAPIARRLSRLSIRQGLLALTRPGAATLGAVVSLGIGVLLILGLELVRDRLANQLQHELPPDAPTAFLINIQPAQWPEVEAVLIDQGSEQVVSVPVVTARLRAVDGQSTTDLAAGETEGDRRWALTREQRLTYMSELPADNVILAGELWADDRQAEVSVEQDFARELGVEVGSRLEFDLQGVAVDLAVTSIRSVEWTSFGINFYLVVEPGVLEEAPHQRVATARLPIDREQAIQDQLADSFPNVTLLKMREILERLAMVLGFLARGVSFIGAFTAIAGVVILAGGISADSVRRREHIALLKTLGMTQTDIAAMLAVEFTVIGLVAGLIGGVGGNLLSWTVITRGLELEWRFQPLTLMLAIGVTVLLTATTGILSCRRALRQPPAVILRGD